LKRNLACWEPSLPASEEITVTAIGVFCARVRVEEKQIIGAIGAAGFAAVPVPPASTPLPPGPASSGGSMLGDLLGASTNGQQAKLWALVDRASNRSVASATLPMLRAAGVAIVDAGMAATGSRIDVASALSAAGVARPATLVGFSEETSMAAASRLGYPAVMLGLQPGSSSTVLHDADTADAVIEHRVVLGNESEAIVLIQAGAPTPEQRSVVHVVGGRAIAFSGAVPGIRTISLAEAAASALRASFVAVDIVLTDEGLVVWDVLPVAEFRQSVQLGDLSVADALAQEIALRVTLAPSVALAGEVPRGYAISA
jgi:[lysine-biosynthesis-protein LysW]--L-2-aminoadipate ligase